MAVQSPVKPWTKHISTVELGESCRTSTPLRKLNVKGSSADGCDDFGGSTPSLEETRPLLSGHPKTSLSFLIATFLCRCMKSTCLCGQALEYVDCDLEE